MSSILTASHWAAEVPSALLDCPPPEESTVEFPMSLCKELVAELDSSFLFVTYKVPVGTRLEHAGDEGGRIFVTAIRAQLELTSGGRETHTEVTLATTYTAAGRAMRGCPTVGPLTHS